MSGFIALHREAREHPLFAGNAERFGAWFWLVATACWRPTKFNAGGTIITLERGQLCVSRTQLATAWGMSPSAVERFLTRLQTEQMIGRSTGQARSIITICNYDTYQGKNDETGQPTGQPTGQRPDSDRTTKEQWNNGTMVSEEPYGPSSTTPAPAKSKRAPSSKFLIPADWTPGPFPADVAELVAQWPPGRMDREIPDFRDFWIENGAKRPGWDRTFHSRLRMIHDRVLREARNDRPNQPPRNNRSSDEPLNPFVRAAAERQAERAAHGEGQSGGWPDHGDGFEGMAGISPD